MGCVTPGLMFLGAIRKVQQKEEQTSKQGSSIASASVSAMSSLDGGLTTGSELK